jgi:hypothetical protein
MNTLAIFGHVDRPGPDRSQLLRRYPYATFTAWHFGFLRTRSYDSSHECNERSEHQAHDGTVLKGRA